MTKLIGVDLFAGAGGMTLGAKLAGIDVQLAVEMDINAALTYSFNHPEVRLIPGDIAGLTEIPVEKSPGSQTVLFGGPPCQGFSTSNQKTRTANNPRNWLFKEFLCLAEQWKPDWIVFENVKGITETEHGTFLQHILKNIRTLGYTPFHSVLNSACFGIPQRRERLFVIASRNGLDFHFPVPTVDKPIPVSDALADLPQLSNGADEDVLPYREMVEPSNYAKMLRGQDKSSSGHLVSRNADYVVQRYKHIPQGGNWQNIPSGLMLNYSDASRCHTGIYHRLDPDLPSIVIGNYRKNMLIHPCEDRGLSVREAARIQSFPDSYQFYGSIGFQQQQVGNAVPPLLARSVFESLVATAT